MRYVRNSFALLTNSCSNQALLQHLAGLLLRSSTPVVLFEFCKPFFDASVSDNLVQVLGNGSSESYMASNCVGTTFTRKKFELTIGREVWICDSVSL